MREERLQGVEGEESPPPKWEACLRVKKVPNPGQMTGALQVLVNGHLGDVFRTRTKALDGIVDALLSVMASPRSWVWGRFMKINCSLDWSDSARDCQPQVCVLVDNIKP